LAVFSRYTTPVANPIVYADVSIGYSTIGSLDARQVKLPNRGVRADIEVGQR
jgi:hypothetical protein